jgi:ParB-like chromosome segregation protein Spo0J
MKPPTVEVVDIATLVSDPRNARKHDDRNLAAITASLQRFGQQKPIVVGEGNVVIAGNGQLAAALALGWATIAIVRTDLLGEEATAYAIADNRTAELAMWDQAALDELLRELQEADASLVEAAGFDFSKLVNRDEADEPTLDEQAFKLIVDCGNEQQQRELMERLEQEGYKCHPLMS